MKTPKPLLLILALLFSLGLMACGEAPSSVASPSGSAQVFPQLKKAEELGYVNAGYFCTQVVTAMFKVESNTCVIALDGCQGAYLESRGFRADTNSLCELAQ